MGGEGSWNNIPAIEFENNFLVALLDENFTKKNAYNPTILTYHFDFYISINLFLFFYWFSFSRFLPPFRFCFNKKEKHIRIISTTEIFQSSTFQLFMTILWQQYYIIAQCMKTRHFLFKDHQNYFYAMVCMIKAYINVLSDCTSSIYSFNLWM